jgi:hypothetical protein
MPVDKWINDQEMLGCRFRYTPVIHELKNEKSNAYAAASSAESNKAIAKSRKLSEQAPTLTRT